MLDMLFKRYSNPMILLDSMIRTNRFSEFIHEFVIITNEELEDHTLWELWLHRVINQDWNEYYNQAKPQRTERVPLTYNLETTVKESAEMLNGFHLS